MMKIAWIEMRGVSSAFSRTPSSHYHQSPNGGAAALSAIAKIESDTAKSKSRMSVLGIFFLYLSSSYRQSP
jgi:hypothetical protein